MSLLTYQLGNKGYDHGRDRGGSVHRLGRQHLLQHSGAKQVRHG